VEDMAKRVLVIDDLGIILDLVEYLLQMAGYEVVAVRDAPTTLAQVETISCAGYLWHPSARIGL
jgi:CheY-like chemotaxis protein